MRYFAAFAIASMLASPAIAQDSWEIGAGAGIAGGFSSQEYEQDCYRPNPRTGACNTRIDTIDNDKQGPAIAGFVRYNLNDRISLEARATMLHFDRANAGHCRGNPGFDGKPCSPEGGRDATQVGIGALLVSYNLPLDSKTTISPTVGGNFSCVFSGTSYASPELNQGWRGGDDGKCRPGATLALRLSHQVGPRTTISMWGSYEMLALDGGHVFYKRAESGTPVGSDTEKLRMPVFMLEVRQRIGS